MRYVIVPNLTFSPSLSRLHLLNPVKVPVKTTQIVTEMVDRRVPVKKLVEYDGYTERDEVQRVRVPVKKFKEVEEWTTVKGETRTSQNRVSTIIARTSVAVRKR